MNAGEYQLASQLEAAFNSIGASMMSNGFAAKLLAWLYVYGGGNEEVVYNRGLVAGIAIAQQKFNIKGGKIPKKISIPLIRTYVRQLERYGSKTRWLDEIYQRYNIKFRPK